MGSGNIYISELCSQSSLLNACGLLKERGTDSELELELELKNFILQGL